MAALAAPELPGAVPRACGDGDEEEHQEEEEEEEDIILLGTRGGAADLPHARQHCPVHAFDPAEPTGHGPHCPACFCWVCDEPVAACSSWPDHCHAHTGDPKWRGLREQRRRAAAVAAAAAVSCPPTASQSCGWHFRQSGPHWVNAGKAFPSLHHAVRTLARQQSPPPGRERLTVLLRCRCALCADVARFLEAGLRPRAGGPLRLELPGPLTLTSRAHVMDLCDTVGHRLLTYEASASGSMRLALLSG